MNLRLWTDVKSLAAEADASVQETQAAGCSRGGSCHRNCPLGNLHDPRRKAGGKVIAATSDNAAGGLWLPWRRPMP